VISSVLIMQWSVHRGFLRYVDSLEKTAVSRLAAKLEQQYREDPGWESVLRDPALLTRLALDSLPEHGPHPGEEHHGPPSPGYPGEGVARVRVVLRRTCGAASLHSAGLVLDEARFLATLDGRDLGLTAVEFKLLSYLAASPGRIYGRQQLMDHIYPDERIVADRTIDSHIKKLRRKIALAAPETDLIHSVYGVGYKFEVRSDKYNGG
jgi:two-component system response regulator BaeR